MSKSLGNGIDPDGSTWFSSVCIFLFLSVIDKYGGWDALRWFCQMVRSQVKMFVF